MSKTIIITILLAVLGGCASDLPLQSDTGSGVRYDPSPSKPWGYEDYCSRHPESLECGGK